MVRNSRTHAKVKVIGLDRKGVVASVTNFIFEHQGNIEKINQKCDKRTLRDAVCGFFSTRSIEKERIS